MTRVGQELVVPFTVGEPEETFSERLIEHMQPWMTESLETYCRAIAKPYETILEACEEEGTQGEDGWVPAWGKLFNIEECPYQYLPYLGMFVGTKIPQKATEQEARNQIQFGCNLNRGTKRHLEYVIAEALGPGESFFVEERRNGLLEERAYFFLVYVKAGKASSLLYEKINEAKPAGLWYEVIEEHNIWLQGGKRWGEVEVGLAWTEMLEGRY